MKDIQDVPLKIQGKKTKLVAKIRDISDKIIDGSPNKITTWIEPFCGSGIVAFNAPDKIENVIVADTNPHIINFYNMLKDGTPSIFEIHRYLEVCGSMLEASDDDGTEIYNMIRQRFNALHSSLDFLFLSRTSFNGMMRFNKKGEWNLPFCKVKTRLNKKNIDEICNRIIGIKKIFQEKNYEFICQDYTKTLESADRHSIVYCDPPYYGLFTTYHDTWNKEDEMNLHSALSNSESKFIYSNWKNDGLKDNPMIDELWKGYEIECINHRYDVGAKASSRREVIEVLIHN